MIYSFLITMKGWNKN